MRRALAKRQRCLEVRGMRCAHFPELNLTGNGTECRGLVLDEDGLVSLVMQRDWDCWLLERMLDEMWLRAGLTGADACWLARWELRVLGDPDCEAIEQRPRERAVFLSFLQLTAGGDVRGEDSTAVGGTFVFAATAVFSDDEAGRGDELLGVRGAFTLAGGASFRELGSILMRKRVPDFVPVAAGTSFGVEGKDVGGVCREPEAGLWHGSEAASHLFGGESISSIGSTNPCFLFLSTQCWTFALLAEHRTILWDGSPGAAMWTPGSFEPTPECNLVPTNKAGYCGDVGRYILFEIQFGNVEYLSGKPNSPGIWIAPKDFWIIRVTHFASFGIKPW